MSVSSTYAHTSRRFEIEEREEGGRGEAGGDRLAFLGGHRRDDTADGRRDACVRELSGREVETRLGTSGLLLCHGAGTLGYVEIAGRQEAFFAEPAFAPQVGPGVRQVGLRQIAGSGGFDSPGFEVAGIEFGQQLPWRYPVADADEEACHDTRDTRADTDFGPDHRPDDTCRLDDVRQGAPADAYDVRLRHGTSRVAAEPVRPDRGGHTGCHDHRENQEPPAHHVAPPRAASVSRAEVSGVLLERNEMQP